MCKLFKNFLIFLLFVCSYSTVFATPNISGIIVENNTLVVSGASFGSKTPAAPILWDDFEGGTINNVLQSAGVWEQFSNNPGAQFTNEHSYSGLKSAFNRYPAMGGFNTNQFSFVGTPADELYYSYRWRVQENHNPALSGSDKRVIIKQGRMSGNGDPYRGEGAMYISGGQLNSSPIVSYDNDGDGYINTGYISAKNSPELWHRHEMYKKLSTPGGSDGALWVAINGTTQRNLSGIVTRASGENFTHERILLALMGTGAGPEADVSFFVDDVYVDNTRSRVELGDHPEFWSASNRELQIPISWSSSQIKVSINRGVFRENDPLYVFVVDANGEPSSGYGPIFIGGSQMVQPLVDPPPKLRIEQ